MALGFRVVYRSPAWLPLTWRAPRMMYKLRSIVEPRTRREAIRFVVAYTSVAAIFSVSFAILSIHTIGSGPDAFIRAAIIIPLILAPPMSWIVANTMLRYEAMRQELARVVCIDPLSGVLNRRGLQQFAELGFAAGARLSAIIFDVDRFKSINDTYGHAAGDAVIAQLARIIAASGNSGNFAVGRLGGDELAAFFTMLSLEETMIRAESMRQAIEDAVLIHDGRRIMVTASIGVAAAEPEDADLNPILKRADQALYAAKSAGRNRVRAAA
ncbi:MAG: hypothetical protein CTY15_05020 [Methylocystis sp.]|nr:MAG: hypothetical protein CTY15_05020 [Methylocystis sp.]